MCFSSWNKLFGMTRCGLLSDNHFDSDRFVWRRAQSCALVKDDKFTVGVVENCTDKDLIELATYAYDNGDKPFDSQNQGRLLKVFNTKVRVDSSYGYKLTNKPTTTIYELFDSNGNLLETQNVEHRDCGSSYKQGTLQMLYFGGQCPAPSQVDVCYEE